jgi:hypothetical protein
MATASVRVLPRTWRTASRVGSLNPSPPVGGAQCGRMHAEFPNQQDRTQRSALGRASWWCGRSREMVA